MHLDPLLGCRGRPRHWIQTAHELSGSPVTFLGGFAWGWPDDQKNQELNLSYGIGFSLLGCSMLLLTYFGFIMTALILAIISFYLFYLFEKSTVIFDTKDEDYQKFRKILTLLVCISFLISSGYWINPYSSPYL